MFAIGASTRVAAVNAAAPARASAAARSRAAPSSSTALVGRSGAISLRFRAASARRTGAPVHAHPRGLTVVARVANTTPPGGPGGDAGDTRLSSGVSGIVRSIRGNVSKNFTKLPWALVALLIGFAMTAYFPHPESPGDAPICLTIVFLAEFLSSVLYSPKRPRGILKFLKFNDLVPLVLNNFKLGVLYGLFCDAFKVGS
jgi:hypothetical protein